MSAYLSLSLYFKISKSKIVGIMLQEEVKPSKSQLQIVYLDGEKEASLEANIHEWVRQYLDGKEPNLSLPLEFNHLPYFTQKVLKALMLIPFGKLTTYKQLAEIVGSPAAARAIGGCCGKNPFLLVVPCHRVIASDGSLGGFSAGLNIKTQLLQFENALL